MRYGAISLIKTLVYRPSRSAYLAVDTIEQGEKSDYRGISCRAEPCSNTQDNDKDVLREGDGSAEGNGGSKSLPI